MADEHSILEYPDGNKALFLEGPLTDRIIAEIVHRKVNRLVVEVYSPWKATQLGLLHDVINELWIHDPKAPTALADGFRNLKGLHLESSIGEIDFGQFPKLTACEFAHQTSFPVNLKSCKSLVCLTLSDSKLKSLEGVAEFGALQKLVLKSVSVPSLSAISTLRRLRHFGLSRSTERDLGFLAEDVALESCYLAYMTKLTSLSGIERLTKLADFSLASCSGVVDVTPLSHLKNLERLLVESCSNLQSLRPLLVLKQLSKILLWENTKILDGDLRCLLELPKLKELSFRDRNNYNLTQAEAKAALSK